MFWLYLLLIIAFADQLVGENLLLACDDLTELFLDGVQFTDPAFGNWRNTANMSIPSNTNVIAISCENLWAKYGIKATTSSGIVTDATWRCSNVKEDNWMGTDFDDSTWEFAKTDNLDVDRDENTFDGQWIWSQTGTDRAYCRKRTHLEWTGQCVQDDQSRLLDHYESITDNTPSACIQLCRRKGFKYAGVQYAILCFCGNEAPPSDRIRSETECDIKCPGDDSKKCGGTWRMNVYAVAPDCCQPLVESDYGVNYTGKYAFLMEFNERPLFYSIKDDEWYLWWNGHWKVDRKQNFNKNKQGWMYNKGSDASCPNDLGRWKGYVTQVMAVENVGSVTCA